MLHGVDMEVTVELGRTRMTVRELLALAPGAVLELDRAAGSPADLLVNGRLIARGEVVVVDEDFGLRVTEIVDDARGELTMLELTVRLIASLAVVVGLLLLIAKVGGRRMRGRSGSLVQVVHRQPLSPHVRGRRRHRRRRGCWCSAPPSSRSACSPSSTPTSWPPTWLVRASRRGRRADPSRLPARPDRADVQPRRTAAPVARRAAPGGVACRRAAGTRARRRPPGRQPDGALAGSVLSPRPGGRPLAAATGKAS